MKGRDIAILGAVAAIGVFAAVDAVRGDHQRAGDAASSPTPAGVVTERPEPVPEAPSAFVGLPAPGRLVFTDGRDCRVRAVDVRNGVELPLPRLGGTCALWAPPAGRAIAYGVANQGADSLATASFRLVDLRRPRENLGGYRALFGFLVWSRDGRRAAWCGQSRRGFDLEVGGAARTLEDCPSAFTPDGRIAYARGNRVVVDEKTVLTVDGAVTSIHWGDDGSIGIGVQGERVERWAGGKRVAVLDLPRRLEGRLPRLSPDNCAAIFVRPGRVELLSLGCFGGDAPRAFAENAAAWSPDGQWIAVAEPETIVFYRVVGHREVVRWLASADELAWTA